MNESRLTSLNQSEMRGRHKHGLFRCSCGNLIWAGIYKVRTGHTRSCGCLQKENAAAAMKTHGLTGSPEYRAWQNMITRCTNQNYYLWKDYGGRGITVCQRWLHSFEAFLESVGPKSYPGAILDREDNNLGYQPGNVRWVSPTESSRNRRIVRHIELQGETKTLPEWSEVSGVPRKTIWRRLRDGWEETSAVFSPT